MTPEEEWAEIDKESIRFKRAAAKKSVCPKHVWIEGVRYSAQCIICGLYRRKYLNQYKYRYFKNTKYSQENVDKRWEMYNRGVDLVEYDEIELNKILEKYS